MWCVSVYLFSHLDGCLNDVFLFYPFSVDDRCDFCVLLRIMRFYKFQNSVMLLFGVLLVYVSVKSVIFCF